MVCLHSSTLPPEGFKRYCFTPAQKIYKCRGEKRDTFEIRRGSAEQWGADRAKQDEGREKHGMTSECRERALFITQVEIICVLSSQPPANIEEKPQESAMEELKGILVKPKNKEKKKKKVPPLNSRWFESACVHKDNKTVSRNNEILK